MSAYPGLRERAAAIVERRRVEVAAGLPPAWSARRGADWLTRARPASGFELDRVGRLPDPLPYVERWDPMQGLAVVAVRAVWWGSGRAPVPEASRVWAPHVWDVASAEFVSFAAGRGRRVGGGAVWLRSGVALAWGAHPRAWAPQVLAELERFSAHVGAYGWGDVVEVDTTD